MIQEAIHINLDSIPARILAVNLLAEDARLKLRADAETLLRDAIQCLRDALGRHPKDAYIWRRLGEVEFDLAELSDSEQLRISAYHRFVRAMALARDHRWSHLGKAKVVATYARSLTGAPARWAWTQVIEEYKSILEVSPNWQPAEEALQQAQRMLAAETA
jgi:hypothetical protein